LTREGKKETGKLKNSASEERERERENGEERRAKSERKGTNSMEEGKEGCCGRRETKERGRSIKRREMPRVSNNKEFIKKRPPPKANNLLLL
jgi:hypothetical protein